MRVDVLLGPVAVLLATQLVPLVAHAQQAPSIARGATLYAEADFEGAIAELERALSDETLSLRDVELALDRIAAAQLALGSRGLDRTLARLALVAPQHRFGPDVPQALSDRFARLSPTVAPLSLTLSSEPIGSGTERVHARVEASDQLQVVRAVELRCGDGFVTGPTPVVEIEVASGVACEAVARGPGGVPLARASRGAEVPSHRPLDTPGAPATSDDALWIGLGIGGGVLVLGAILAGVGVAVSSGEQPITVVGPTIRF